jgi:hypothetical protein
MKHRNPLIVFILPFITLGIYQLYWLVKTKREMNKKGEKILTAWILLIPLIGSIWFYWVYSKGVDHVTDHKMNNIVSFLLLYLLGSIGSAIIQDSFNSVPIGGQQNWNASPQATGPVAPVINVSRPSSLPNQPTPHEPQSQNPQIPPQPPVSPSQKPPLVSG